MALEPPNSPAAANNLVGRQLGAYQLVDVIGRGGMAVVYKALQPALRRYVAIKVLPAYFVHQADFRARFQQEAETVARLDHRNILPIYDYGQEGDLPYIVMPLVSGGTLGDWLGQAPPLAEALQVFSNVLSALDYAHQHQIVHRDLKPSNVLMSQGNWPLLADFGIARIIGPSLRITHSGILVGTPEYMAPEQSEGRAVDHRTDIYALGIILFQILTGRLPYQGATPMSVILQHIQEPVRLPREINPALSPAWDAVILQCMAKDPDQRYQSARALDEAVRAAAWEGQSLSGYWPPGGRPDPEVLHQSAVKALAAGSWQRVILLCGQILRLDPGHAAAVTLLTQAQDALRREQDSQQAQRVEQLVTQAEEALATEQFTIARRYYEEAAAAAPALPQPQEGLARVEEARALASLYYAARVDIAAQRWDEAANKLERLEKRAPGYRDVASLRQEVDAKYQQELLLAAQYDEGSAALARRDWRAAITAFGRVVAIEPAYRDAAVRLVEAREAEDSSQGLANARAALAAGRVQEAVALLETLMRHRPRLTEAAALLATARAQLSPAAAPAPARAAEVETPRVSEPRAVTSACVYVTNRASGTVSVVAVATNTVLAIVPVGGGPLGVGIARGSHVYVSNRGVNAVQVIDPTTNRLVGTIPVGSGPYGVAVHPDGSRVYVTARFSGTVAVIDTASQQVIATVPVGRTPSSLALDSSGTRVYVSNCDSHSVSVIDTASNEEIAAIALPPASSPEGLALSPDDARLYVASFRSDQVIVVDTAIRRVVARVPVGSGPYGVTIHPDGGRAYVSNFDAATVSVIDTDHHRVEVTIPVAQWPRGVAISPDGAHVYVANRGANCLQVIDTNTNAVVATVAVGEGPYGVAIRP